MIDKARKKGQTGWGEILGVLHVCSRFKTRLFYFVGFMRPYLHKKLRKSLELVLKKTILNRGRNVPKNTK